MSHSYVQNHIHLVFSTKDRQKFIAKPLQRKSYEQEFKALLDKHGVEYDPKFIFG